MGGKVRVATIAGIPIYTYGLPLHGITLHILGGVSELGDEAPSPRA